MLGLATGSTPLGIYRELRRVHAEEGVSFAGVVTFNLDEYLGLGPRDPRSFRAFMQRELFDHLDVDPLDVHIPSGTLHPAEVADHCTRYEEAIRAAGGIDLQLLGLGRNGHVAFNEPGSAADSRTRRIELHPVTREDAAGAFGDLEHVPRAAITMGVGTILEARSLRVLAFGPAKARAVRALVDGPRDAAWPASLLRGHRDLRLWIDDDAAAQLTA